MKKYYIVAAVIAMILIILGSGWLKSDSEMLTVDVQADSGRTGIFHEYQHDQFSAIGVCVINSVSPNCYPPTPIGI